MKSMNVKDKRIWIDGMENKITKQKYLGQTIWQKETDVYLAQDSDFVNVNGYWIYKGEPLEVDITDFVNSKKLTTTRYMFSGHSNYKATAVEKVVLGKSSVTNMRAMFYESQATNLDLSSFDTSNVTNTRSMFQNSQVISLDLSSFDASSVSNMDTMFAGSKATTGYAGTQADADNFNSTDGKPSGLVFVVKP